MSVVSLPLSKKGSPSPAEFVVGVPLPKEITLLDRHLQAIRQFYDAAPLEPTKAALSYRRFLADYYSNFIPADASILEVGCGGGHLLELLPNRDVVGIDVSPVQIKNARDRVPHGSFYVMAGEELMLERKFDFIILSETLNFAADVQRILEQVRHVSGPATRLILNFHSGVWRPALAAATRFGLRAKHPPCNWLSSSDMRNLLALAGWEVVRQEGKLLVPSCLGRLEKIANRFFAPVFSPLTLTVFQVARPYRPALPEKSVTVVVPARNEAGNIEAAVRRLPKLGTHTEIIFIEGNSTDNTWSEMQRVANLYPDRDIKLMRQSGKGKGNAVREAFAQANGDVLMILDADLTVPPEELTKFYDVIVSGRADFVNGVRLVYPMEGQAMRFCNFVANKFFGVAFSWALGQPVKDTLCGTKVLFRSDYQRIAAHRDHFGDFDPFGDFDLLFGANHLHLKIADLPIRYRDRTYGETNIQRWSHGVLLFRMLALAVKKIKFI